MYFPAFFILMDYDIISIGAHPDDVEVGSGGILLKAAAQGHKTGIIYLTAGEMGTGGDAALRRQEATDAARVLKADLLKTYDWGDTALYDTYDKRLTLAADIRRYRPRLILCPSPVIGHGRRQSHPDHVACGQIVSNAAGLAALAKIPIDGQPHQISRLYYFFLPPGMAPDLVVDISAYFTEWIEALKCHRSQFLNPEKSRDYISFLESMARHFGVLAGGKYGQGLKADQTILIDDLVNLSRPDRF